MKKQKPQTLKEGDVVKRDSGDDGPKGQSQWRDEDNEWGPWASVTIVKKIVDNDKEYRVYYETARKWLQTGKVEVYKRQTGQNKYLCVNGPKQGTYITSNSDKTYAIYNSGGGDGPKALLIHIISLCNSP